MIATQNHSQAKMLFLLDFLCDNLMHPCNTPSSGCAPEDFAQLDPVSLGIEGAAFIAAGFLLSDRSFRISGLLLFLLCVAKLFVYDLSELDTVSRILSFVVLGVVLMAASWVYTRFRDKLGRLL